jgi:ABC-2 type transport system ATP-binding protein
MSTAPIAEFQAVSKDYVAGVLKRRPVRALSDVTFTLARGEVLGVIGPNRAGKSTVAKILLSLTRPTTGAANRFGEPVARRRTLARIGYTHEHQAFPPYLTPQGVLGFYGTMAGVPQAQLPSLTTKWLERVNLADRATEPVSRFSKGMIARLGLAQALLNDPDLLVLDEPYEGLDVEGQQLVHSLVREHRQQGKSVLLITHAPGDLEKLCDRVLLLKNGKAVYTGTTTELLRDPASGSRQSVDKALQRFFKYAL